MLPLKSSPQWEYLQNALQRRCLPHALLVAGYLRNQQREIALCLTQLLLCQEQTACGHCNACRWLQEDNHPDLLTLPAQENSSIKIDEVREANHHLLQTSHQGLNKAVLICPAEAMSLSACNSLLKTLEEPPPNSFLILMSQFPNTLPATLRSRCQRINLPAPGFLPEQDEITQKLTQTLTALTQRQLNPAEAAQQWAELPLEEMLWRLSLINTMFIYQQIKNIKQLKSLFNWYDLLIDLKRQHLAKQNANYTLVLENLFYQWAKH